MSDLQNTLHDLPLAGLIPVGMLVIVGLLLWAAGRKLLRAGFAIVGLIVGAFVGWMIGVAMPWSVPAWIPAIIGGLGLAGLSAVAYKLAIMWTTAAVLGIFAPMGVIALNEQQAKHGDKTLETTGEKASEWFDKHVDEASREKVGEAVGTAAGKVKERIDEAAAKLNDKLDKHPIGEAAHSGIEELGKFGGRLLEAFKSEWASAPGSLRPMLVISSIVGVLLGLILGFLAPTFSGAMVTSLGGSLLWLAGVRIILLKAGLHEGSWLPASGGAWMAVWLITALVGVGIQWMSKRRKADKTT